jgi:hypothetical protein
MISKARIMPERESYLKMAKRDTAKGAGMMAGKRMREAGLTVSGMVWRDYRWRVTPPGSSAEVSSGAVAR